MLAQVISPQTKGKDGVIALNDHLQRLLNPQAPAAAAVPLGGSDVGDKGENDGSVRSSRSTLFVGDRVLQTVNNYDKGVFNGDQGTVLGINVDERRMSVQFVHLKEPVEYSFEESHELGLAYAITVGFACMRDESVVDEDSFSGSQIARERVQRRGAHCQPFSLLRP